MEKAPAPDGQVACGSMNTSSAPCSAVVLTVDDGFDIFQQDDSTSIISAPCAVDIGGIDSSHHVVPTLHEGVGVVSSSAHQPPLCGWSDVVVYIVDAPVASPLNGLPIRIRQCVPPGVVAHVAAANSGGHLHLLGVEHELSARALVPPASCTPTVTYSPDTPTMPHPPAVRVRVEYEGFEQGPEAAYPTGQHRTMHFAAPDGVSLRGSSQSLHSTDDEESLEAGDDPLHEAAFPHGAHVVLVNKKQQLRSCHQTVAGKLPLTSAGSVSSPPCPLSHEPIDSPKGGGSEMIRGSSRGDLVLRMHALQHAFLLDAPSLHHHSCVGAQPDGVSASAAAVALRQAFRFLAKAPLRVFSRGQHHNGEDSTGTTADDHSNNDLLQYIALHSAQARNAFACAQYCLPWLTETIEASVHHALTSVVWRGVADGSRDSGIRTTARVLKFLTPLAPMRELSVPITAAFHQAASSFLAGFLSSVAAQPSQPSSSSPLSSSDTSKPLYLVDITLVDAQRQNTTTKPPTFDADKFGQHPQTSSVCNVQVPAGRGGERSGCHVVDEAAFEHDANMLFTVAPHLFRTLLNDHEVTAVLASECRKCGTTTATSPPQPLLIARCVLVTMCLLHWSPVAATAPRCRNLLIKWVSSIPLREGNGTLPFGLIQRLLDNIARDSIRSSMTRIGSSETAPFSQSSTGSTVYRRGAFGGSASLGVGQPGAPAAVLHSCDITRLKALAQQCASVAVLHISSR